MKFSEFIKYITFNGRPLQLNSWQKEIVKAIDDGKNVLLANGGRIGGLRFMNKLWITWWLKENPDAKITFVDRNYKTEKLRGKEIKPPFIDYDGFSI